MTPDLAGEVIKQLKWWDSRGVSALFRLTCKGWQEAHDQSVMSLRMTSFRDEFTSPPGHFHVENEISTSAGD
jgi:hypothetical protein